MDINKVVGVTKVQSESDFVLDQDTFTSGKIDVGPDTISDWKKEGWGTISYDEGFYRSSNVGVTNLIQNYMIKKNY